MPSEQPQENYENSALHIAAIYVRYEDESMKQVIAEAPELCRVGYGAHWEEALDELKKEMQNFFDEMGEFAGKVFPTLMEEFTKGLAKLDEISGGKVKTIPEDFLYLAGKMALDGKEWAEIEDYINKELEKKPLTEQDEKAIKEMESHSKPLEDFIEEEE